jgi:Mrp family chromosome partitioning ATPase
MRPFLERSGGTVFPSVEQVAPSLASEKETLSTQYSELQATRSELSSGLRVSSRIVREANLPTEPLASSSKVLVLVGAVAGAFLGLLTAVVVARLSRSVLDDDQAEEILGHDVVGAMPEWPQVATQRSSVLDAPNAEVAQFLDSLGVRVQAVGQGTGSVTAVVCGVRSSAGTTTVAASLALRLASPEMTVLLVDADRHHPEVTSLLSGSDGRADVEVVDTTVQNLQFVTLAGLTALASSLSGDRRPNAELQLSVASTYADVVIVDGGALMGSASTVQLTRASDVVLLAIPQRQSIRGLETVSHELRSRDHLLPVWVPVPVKSAQRPGSSTDDGSDGSDVADGAEDSVRDEGGSTASATNGNGKSNSNGNGNGQGTSKRARQRT